MKKIILILMSISIISLGGYHLYQAYYTNEIRTSVTDPIADIKLSNGHMIRIKLYPQEAPNTVRNFIDLANCGFYENLGFSKILPNYFVQTGDTIGNGTGFPGYFIKSECKANGFNNHLKCEIGTVCMARSEKLNTEGSQFFILLKDAPELDGKYSAFGKVIMGLDNLTALNEDSKLRIKKIKVETFSKHYNAPQVLSMVSVRDSIK